MRETSEATIYPAACVFKSHTHYFKNKMKYGNVTHTPQTHESPACQPSTVGSFCTAHISVTPKLSSRHRSARPPARPREASVTTKMSLSAANQQRLATTFGLAPPTELAALRSALRGKGRCLCTVAAVRRGGNTRTPKSGKTSSCDFWPEWNTSLK